MSAFCTVFDLLVASTMETSYTLTSLVFKGNLVSFPDAGNYMKF